MQLRKRNERQRYPFISLHDSSHLFSFSDLIPNEENVLFRPFQDLRKTMEFHASHPTFQRVGCSLEILA